MGKKILIVEDELLIAKEIQFSMERYKYKIIGIVYDYQHIIDIITEDKPDIVLMDINLKGDKDGISIASEIKEKFNLPVIFITGYSDEETIERAKTAEPYGYVVKPINFEDLKISIEIAVYKHEADIKIKNIEKEKLIKEKMLLRSQRLASLGELSSSIAHEIRQPLQVIKVITDSIIYYHDNMEELEEPCIKHMNNLKKVSKNAERINNIIYNIQDMVKKADRDRVKEIDINKLIKQIIIFFNEKIKNHTINLELDLYESVKKVFFTEIELEQIITNLINNSIDAFESVNNEDKKIIIKTEEKNDSVLMEISDNAKGIPDEIIEKIFDPLFTTKFGSNSMGLGLFIVNNILEANDGYINFLNNDMGGATFQIFLRQEKL